MNASIFCLLVAFQLRPAPHAPTKPAAKSESAKVAFVRQVLTEAEAFAARETSTDTKVTGLTEIAAAWRFVDRQRARKLLGDAWKVAESIRDKSERGRSQGEVTELGWAPLDRREALSMIPRIVDPYWRNMARRNVSANFISSNPMHAKPVLHGIGRSNRSGIAFTAASGLVSRDIDQAVQVILESHSRNRDEDLSAIISYSSPADFQRAVFYLNKLPPGHEFDRAALALIKSSARLFPKECAALAERTRTRLQRPQALANAASALRRSDHPKAKRLAAASLKLLSQLAPDEALFILVETSPQLAEVDPTGLRNTLVALTKKTESGDDMRSWNSFRLAAVWSRIDPKLAQGYFHRAMKLDRRKGVGEHGQFLLDEVRIYIEGLACSNPKQAGQLYKQLVKGASMMSSADFISRDMGLAIADHDPAKALEFAAEHGGESARQLVEAGIQSRLASEDPKNAAIHLQKISNREWHDWAVLSISNLVCRRDVAAAEKVAESAYDPQLRSRAEMELGRWMIRKGNSDGLRILQKARASALQAKRPFIVASSLAAIATAAFVK